MDIRVIILVTGDRQLEWGLCLLAIATRAVGISHFDYDVEYAQNRLQYKGARNASCSNDKTTRRQRGRGGGAPLRL